MKLLFTFAAIFCASLSVFAQCRDGYRAPAVFPTGMNPGKSTTADLLGTGRLDYIVGNGLNLSSVLVRYNNGTTIPYPSYSGAASAVGAGDFNGDGKIDIVLGNQTTAAYSLLLQTSPAAFSPFPGFPLNSTVTALGVLDLNRDGVSDLIYGGSGSGVAYGNHVFPGMSFPIADVDSLAVGLGTGGIPLAVFTSRRGFIAIARMDGPGEQPLVSLQSLALAPERVHFVVFQDFTEDGHLDAVVAEAGAVRLFPGNGAGNISAGLILNVAGEPVSLAAGDLDHDGRLDVAVSMRDGGITPLFGRPGGQFEIGSPIWTPHAAGSLAIIPEPLLPKATLVFVDADGSSGAVLTHCSDPIPPVTVISTSPAVTSFGWQNVPFELTATPVDNPGGSGALGLSATRDGVAIPGLLPLYQTWITSDGLVQFTFSSVDNFGNRESERTVRVGLDRTPPDLFGSSGSLVINENNHRLVNVATIVAEDALSGIPPGGITIDVTSNEPVNGTGDGDTGPDWKIEFPDVFVRAERSAQGTGRVYTITTRVTDRAGNVTTGVKTVTVPK